MKPEYDGNGRPTYSIFSCLLPYVVSLCEYLYMTWGIWRPTVAVYLLNVLWTFNSFLSFFSWVSYWEDGGVAARSSSACLLQTLHQCMYTHSPLLIHFCTSNLTVILATFLMYTTATNIHTYIHIYIYTFIHTHVQINSPSFSSPLISTPLLPSPPPLSLTPSRMCSLWIATVSKTISWVTTKPRL